MHLLNRWRWSWKWKWKFLFFFFTKKRNKMQSYFRPHTCQTHGRDGSDWMWTHFLMKFFTVAVSPWCLSPGHHSTQPLMFFCLHIFFFFFCTVSTTPQQWDARMFSVPKKQMHFLLISQSPPVLWGGPAYFETYRTPKTIFVVSKMSK